MRNRGTPVLVTLVLALAACFDAESRPHERSDAEHHGRVDTEHAHVHDGLEADSAIIGESVYNLTGHWWDAAGDTAPLSRLAGRPQVVAMVYTSCAQACPAIIAEMKRIEAALGDDGPAVGFVLASMDPERDTSEKLARFAERARLDASRWTLLGADPGDVLELAAVLGVQFRRLSGGEFTHSNVLIVLDANGEIVHRQFGLGEETERTVATLRAL